MQLYRIGYNTEFGPRIAWRGTQADARKAEKDLEEQFGRHEVEKFEAVNVPTDKAGLLDFLNENAKIGEVL
jgi:hypothetical protein